MGERPFVAGVDSSTQSCKVVVWDPVSGEVVREGRAPHPEGTEVDPRAWWDALNEASMTCGRSAWAASSTAWSCWMSGAR